MSAPVKGGVLLCDGVKSMVLPIPLRPGTSYYRVKQDKVSGNWQFSPPKGTEWPSGK